LKFHLQVEPNEREYVLAHDEAICARLQTALLLLLQEMHAADLKRETVIGKGISDTAAVETANTQERLAADHAAKFGDSEAALIAEINRNRQLGSMVLPKEH
jgi:hypothetical protein